MLSHQLFESIAERAVSEVKGAFPAKKSKGLFKVKGPAAVSFRNDGKVEVKLDVTVARGAPVQDVCLKIQESVASNIQMMCETLPFAVKIRVVSLA